MFRTDTFRTFFFLSLSRLDKKYIKRNLSHKRAEYPATLATLANKPAKIANPQVYEHRALNIRAYVENPALFGPLSSPQDTHSGYVF